MKKTMRLFTVNPVRVSRMFRNKQRMSNICNRLHDLIINMIAMFKSSWCFVISTSKEV